MPDPIFKKQADGTGYIAQITEDTQLLIRKHGNGVVFDTIGVNGKEFEFHAPTKFSMNSWEKHISNIETLWKDARTYESEMRGIYFEIVNEKPPDKQPKIIFKDKFSPRAIANQIISESPFIYDKHKRLWFYSEESGIWQEHGAEMVNKWIRDASQDDSLQRNHYVKEVVGYIQGACFKDTFPDTSARYVPFQNCVYDLEEKKIVEFSPDMYLTTKFEATVIKNGACPKIDKFMNEILENKEREKLIEWFAYSLYGEYVYQKFLILYGSGWNGKGVAMSILQKILGVENISSEDLHDLIAGGFSIGNLWNKYVNIAGDVAYSDITDTKILKKLTGQDFLSCNRKHKHAFPFMNKAKLIFITNQPPKTHDKSTGFYRRIQVIEFPNDFEKTDDCQLKNKLISPEELGGFSWKLVQILQSLYDNGFKFSHVETVDEMRKKYEKISNPVAGFISDNCEYVNVGYVYRQDFYKRFDEYCHEKNIHKRKAYETLHAVADDSKISAEKNDRCPEGRMIFNGIIWKSEGVASGGSETTKCEIAILRGGAEEPEAIEALSKFSYLCIKENIETPSIASGASENIKISQIFHSFLMERSFISDSSLWDFCKNKKPWELRDELIKSGIITIIENSDDFKINKNLLNEFELIKKPKEGKTTLGGEE